MSNLIIPGAAQTRPSAGGETLSIGWSQADVPQALIEDLEVNPHLFKKYVDSVRTAVQLSLNHPVTKPRILSESALKERLAMCHRALVIMREELGMSLHQAFDRLPQFFVDALLRGQRVEDMAAAVQRRASEIEGGVTGETWKKDGEERVFIADTKEDLAPQTDLRKLAQQEE